MARDLEEEDFIIGQLYVDELVNETPVIASRVTPKPQRGSDGRECNNALGLECSGDDNALLYETINSWLGVPYKYGCTDRNGIDCSAFVGTVFREVYGVTLHRTSNDMLQDVTLIGRSQLREGDLLFFTNSRGKVSHVGIYLKNNLFAHSSTSNGVSVSGFHTLDGFGKTTEEKCEDRAGVTSRGAENGACCLCRAIGNGCVSELDVTYRTDCEAHICTCITVRNGENVQIVDFLFIIFKAVCRGDERFMKCFSAKI
jgi:hypothetical protein